MSDASVHSRSLRVAVLALATLAVLLAVTGPALAEDTEPPEWGNATKADATTIDVTIYDDGTLDIASIEREDFVLTAKKTESKIRTSSSSTPPIENISVEENKASGNRTGARISLHLEYQMNENNVTIGIRNGESITDSAGNRLTDKTVNVTGMDTVPPQVRGYELSRVNESTVEIRAESNEPLSVLRLLVGGPEVAELSRANFTESRGATLLYTAKFTMPEAGEYTFLWKRASDEYGNTIQLERLEQFRYNGSAPNVTLEGPDNATVGEPVNFTARNSTDDQQIDQFQWRIDGGTIIPGESIRVAFATPGIHEVTVDVTDPYGNTGTETRRVSVAPAQGSDDGVTINRSSDTEVTASVEGTGLTQLLRAPNETLVHGSNASLDRLTASFPANQTATLTVRAHNETPSSFTAGTGLGMFEIAHGETPVDQVTFWFSVDRATLDRAGIDPEALSLYRNEDGWTPLSTTLVGGGDRVVYRATAPGLSEFVVGGNSATDDAETDEPQPDVQTGTPSIAVSNVTVEPESLSAGEQAVLTITLANDGNATGDYLVTVFLNDSELATRAVTVPAGETRTTEFARELPEGGSLQVGNQRVANVSSPGGGSGGMLSGLPSLPGVPSLPSLPNPLALWPGGIIGTVLGALVGGVVVIYGVLKGLAIYLGY